MDLAAGVGRGGGRGCVLLHKKEEEGNNQADWTSKDTQREGDWEVKFNLKQISFSVFNKLAQVR